MSSQSAPSPSAAVSVPQMLEQARLTPTHWAIVGWCALVVFLDGYDLFMFGVLLPLLMQDWILPASTWGWLGSAPLVGMMVGGTLFGTLADRWGRRRIIMLCVGILGLFTMLNGQVESVAAFALCRFMTGLGVGGVMPNAVALVSEYAPRHARNMLVALMLAGYALGGMAAALVGQYVLPLWGWRGMLYSGGVALLVLPLLWRYLPDAPVFLLRRGQGAQLLRLLQRLVPGQMGQAGQMGHDPQQLVWPAPTAAQTVPVLALWQHGRARNTAMLCLTFFMSLLLTYGLSVWLPAMMLHTHAALFVRDAASGAAAGMGTGVVLVALNTGSMTGSVGGGWLADRVRIRPVLAGLFLLGGAALMGLGLVVPQGLQGGAGALLLVLIAIAGAASIGATSLVYACAAQCYPSTIRATGIGWAVSVGRLGAVAGPTVIGGWLVQAMQEGRIGTSQAYLWLALPALLAAVAVLLVQTTTQPDATPPVPPQKP